MTSTEATTSQDDRGIAMYEHLPTPPETHATLQPTVQDVAVVPTYDAGWYPDPHGGAGLRFHDGSAWTEHRHDLAPAVAAPPAPAAPNSQQIVVNTYVAQSAAGGAGSQPKSAALAFVLTFIFGPFGMLYSTISGGLVMLVLDIILVPLTFGLILPILWPIQLVWAVVAANNANRAVGGNANAGPGAGGLANQVAS